MRQAYKDIRYTRDRRALLDTLNVIIAEYQQQGFILTVRQLYYQLVARDFIANTLQEYKRIASLLNDGRLSGDIDWDAIEDRTREFVRRSSWSSGGSILHSAAHSFHMDMWETQDVRPFVIVEKEALVGVFERVCNTWDAPVLAARGYPSVSVVREFVEHDMVPAMNRDQQVHIFHFGDHDPSGIDMSRDLETRFDLLLKPYGYEGDYVFKRCALNMHQIREQKPPENPAKTTDSRFAKYRKAFGTSSWELDALNPDYLSRLVTNEMNEIVDFEIWDARNAEIEQVRERLSKVATDFDAPKKRKK